METKYSYLIVRFDNDDSVAIVSYMWVEAMGIDDDGREFGLTQWPPKNINATAAAKNHMQPGDTWKSYSVVIWGKAG